MDRMILILLVLFSSCGCAERLIVTYGDDHSGGDAADRSSAEQGGGDDNPLVHMPVPYGRSLQCTQGANGSYSHSGNATRFGLDLDTSNDWDTEVYAPAAGIAHVHEDAPNANFGKHVNVDLGDGSYIVLGHLKTIVIKEGQPVSAGTLIGLEGCTGSCTGDHIHFDRHEGDASKKAELGTSVSMRVETMEGILAAEDFVCSLESGHQYTSKLKAACAHPNGSLVKAPQSPHIFRIDAGKVRHIVDEGVFYSYGYDYRDVLSMSQEAYAAYQHDAPINQQGMVGAGYDEQYQLWIFVGDLSHSNRFRQRVPDTNWLEILNSWGIEYSLQDEPPLLTNDDILFAEWPMRSGEATFRDGTLLKMQNQTDVYVVSDGKAVPIETNEVFHLAGYDPARIIEIRPGTLSAHFAEIGSCYGSQSLCLTHERVTTCAPIEFGAVTESGGPSDEHEEPAHEDEPEHEASEDDPLEPHDLFPLDGGELAVVFFPPEDRHPESMWMALEAHEGEGYQLAAETTDPDVIIARGIYPAPGDTPHFAVSMSEDGYGYPGCDEDGPYGEFIAYFEGEELLVETALGGTFACYFEVEIPGMAEYDDDGADEGDVVVMPPEEVPEPEEENEEEIPEGDPPPENAGGIQSLDLLWTMPFSEPANRITLSGEYKFHDGSFGFFWHELKTVHDIPTIHHLIDGVGSGDSFRFSVEFERSNGSVSWSCIGPYVEGTSQEGTLQGSVSAEVGGMPVLVETTGDPTGETTGCGLILTIP